ncbi:MAG: hypothetical protein BWY78_00239 [Alphaproteobacteria bacterium ADurb.Bin438]|nr:MAG: hypothetical protein BWY78_00239 [Alphaproteobacteria bacterium ADurb.Bin438]
MFFKEKGDYDAIQNDEVMKKIEEVLEKMKNKKSFWNIF